MSNSGQAGDMHADEMVLGAHAASPAAEHLAALRQQRDRVFWLGLAAAFLVHVLFIVGIGSARQRTLGAPDGAADAIAVEIVDGATLKESMEPPTPATVPPGVEQPTAALPPPPPAQPPPEPQAQPEPSPEVAEPAPAAAAPPEAPAPAKEAPKLTAEALPALEDAPPEETAKPKPAPEAQKAEQPDTKQKETKQAEPKKPPKQQEAKQPPKKRTQTSALDLSVPYDGADDGAESGGSSAVQRPPGITRSGENDEFARNVIRALQRSMPRERALGRVTVRIVLNENGSRADVKLLKSGGDSDLDFNVVFAARQTAYPFPPKNSTLVDRTFTVTYIYR